MLSHARVELTAFDEPEAVCTLEARPGSSADTHGRSRSLRLGSPSCRSAVGRDVR